MPGYKKEKKNKNRAEYDEGEQKTEKAKTLETLWPSLLFIRCVEEVHVCVMMWT